MTDSAAAHRELMHFCTQGASEYPGVALGHELFSYLLKKAIDQLNGMSTIYPQDERFLETYTITFSAVAIPDEMTTEIQAAHALPGDYPAPQILIRNLKFKFIIYLNDTEMSNSIVEYKVIVATVRTDNKHRPRLVIARNPSGVWVEINRTWAGMRMLPDGREFLPDLRRQWEAHETAARMIAKNQLGASFVEAIDIPNILAMVQGFAFLGSPRVGGATDLIMFSGPAEWKMGCPRSNTPTSLEVSSATTTESGVEYGVNVHDTPDGMAFPETASPERVTNADIFVHLPSSFVRTRFEGVAKPAAGFTDDGSVGPIHWHYEAALTPQNINIDLMHLWPLTFKVGIPSKAYGSAGAGVKIGCIYYEVTGVAFYGIIDPLEVAFQIDVDATRLECFFEARLHDVKAHSFQYHHWPDALEFPIDEVIDFILARATESLVNGKAGSVLAVSRFSLAQFQLVRHFGKMKPAMSAEQDVATNRVTVGFVFEKS